MSKKMKGNLIMMLTAMIWGSAFVAQKQGMDIVGPIAFNGVRTILAALVLIPVIIVLDKAKGENKQKLDKTHLIGGICCGCALFLGANIQQVGIYYTSVAHSGFITALYVVIVPLLGIFVRKRVTPVLWCCVAASAVGLYLLCIPTEGFGEINVGDIVIFACAVAFAVHILIIDHFSPKTDGVKLSCIQFIVSGILSLIFMPLVDPALGFGITSVDALLDCWMPIAYAGVLSSGVGYTLQIVAQKNTDPTVASMILCLESVFALIAGMIILREMMSLREIAGCVIMFIAIVVANLQGTEKSETPKAPETQEA
ncbi:MAG: DMT family transporter [Clostridia bacterium]|nr:DMT family transporter [Clostridia bacterium]